MDSKQDNNVGSRTFSHITVGQDDVDEVIHAGIPSQQLEQPAAQPEPLRAEAVLQPATPQPKPAQEEIPAPSQPAAGAGKKDPYAQTTLADLEESSMPTAQKVVLVVAALLIVAAVAYCVVFM